MIKLYISLIVLCLCIININAQKNWFPEGLIINLKGGYHFKDDRSGDRPTVYDETVPGGINFELSGELPTGNDWYVGLCFDYLNGNDVVYDPFIGGISKRNLTVINYSFPVSKRIHFDRSAILFQAGIGKVTVYESYDRFKLDPDGGVSFIFRIGLDYNIAPLTLFSISGQYLGISEIKFDSGGRSNSIFLFKAGISYILVK